MKFKLVYRSAEDPNYQKGTLADRVFQVMEEKKSGKPDPEREAKKAKILSGFSDKDLGKFANARKIENFEVDADEEIDRKVRFEDEDDEEDMGQKKKKSKSKGIEQRDDLWINQINKGKATNSIEKKTEAQEEDWEDIIEKKTKKTVEKEEEWEEWEDFGEYEEIEEIVEEENEENEEEEEKKEEKNEKNATKEKNAKNEKLKEKSEEIQKLSQLSAKILEREDPINILKNFEVNKNVKMKYYDENGLLVDGYDYYQHIAKKDSEGVVSFVYNAEYEKPPELKPDFDYLPEEMTPERKKSIKFIFFKNFKEKKKLMKIFNFFNFFRKRGIRSFAIRRSRGGIREYRG